MRPAAFALLGLLLNGIPKNAQDPKPQTQESTVPKSAAATGSIPANDTLYKIGAQDVLRIDVWKEPDIARTGLPVRPDGKISLPLLNDVQAAGLSPSELSQVITDGLKKFINNPQVTVTVMDINSRRIYVMGEVSHPGSFPLLPSMTVLQALGSAGSFTQFAHTKAIYVLRTEDGKQVKHFFNYRDVIKGNHPEQNIELRPGDTIVVP